MIRFFLSTRSDPSDLREGVENPEKILRGTSVDSRASRPAVPIDKPSSVQHDQPHKTGSARIHWVLTEVMPRVQLYVRTEIQPNVVQDIQESLSATVASLVRSYLAEHMSGIVHALVRTEVQDQTQYRPEMFMAQVQPTEVQVPQVEGRTMQPQTTVLDSGQLVDFDSRLPTFGDFVAQ